MFYLGQDGEVIGVDHYVSGIFEGSEQVQGFVEPKANLMRWIEFRSCCHMCEIPLRSDPCPNDTVSQGRDTAQGFIRAP